MLSDAMKRRIRDDALEAEAQLIERDLDIETVREWLGAINDTEILCIIIRYRRQFKATNDINRDSTYRLIGKDLCAYIEECVMSAAEEQLEGKIDEIYREAEIQSAEISHD